MLRRPIIVGMLSALSMTAAKPQDGPIVVETDSALLVRSDFPQRLDARYRLFKTRNNWTFLELDTATGRIWQLQFSVDEKAPAGRWVLNESTLAADGKPGRFTLYETGNNWNYILLDQETGKTWQAQFSMDDQYFRGINALPDMSTAVASPEPTQSETRPNPPVRSSICTPAQIRLGECLQKAEQ